ncbi:hypothetical protein DLREEDagrD3_28780 [Denitratisoma sp. agr-D3]
MQSSYVTCRKCWWKSRVIWFNVLIGALATLEASANLIQPYVPGNVYGWGLLLLTVGNTVLRTITTQGVSLK